MTPTIPEQAVQAAANAAHEELLSMAKQMNVPMEYTQSISVNNYRVMRAALTAAAPHLAAVRVKKLEWTAAPNEAGRDGLWFIAIDLFGKKHEVIKSFNGQKGEGWTYGRDWFPALEAAKAAAQADYEARILSALEPSAGRAAVLEEAAKNCEREAAEVEGLIDDVAYHLRKRAAAIRALSSPDHADANLFEILGKNPHLPKDGVKPDMEGIKSVVGRLSYRFPDHADTTDEMVEAALAVDWDNEDERATVHNIWHAMAAKLPTAPDADAGKVEGDGCERCGGKGEIVVGKGRHGDTIIEDCPSCSTPQDVINLVIAAREACDTWLLPECEFKLLDKALEAFSERVPYENEPDALPSAPSEGAE